MKLIRRASNGVWSVGTRVWFFTGIRVEDNYNDTDDYGSPIFDAYRQFVLHIGRFHIVAEWGLK